MPLEELRDRLRAEAAQWNGEYKTYGDVFRNGKDEGLKYAADELDKIIEGMCDVALKACDPFRNYANPEQAKCLTHNGEIDCKHEWGTLNNDGVTKICVTCSFQPTDNLQPRGEREEDD
jgi:hypothetical protein